MSSQKNKCTHTYSQKAWGFALIWITLSCSWGLAKPINSLLSYNGFFPLSRLTYCTYLIHPTVMMLTSFQCESPIHLKHGMIVSYKLEIYDFSHWHVSDFSIFAVDSVLWQCGCLISPRIPHIDLGGSARYKTA